MIDHACIERILGHGVKAPSGDNSQPWHFSIEKESVLVHALPERDHPILNIEARGTYLAIGALLENIIISSHEEGLSSVIELFPNDTAVARIRFIEKEKESHRLFHAIEKRHSHRGAYRTDIPSDILERLRTIKEGGAYTQVIHDQSAIRAIANAASMMEEVALQSKKLHGLFFKNLIWKSSKNKSGDSGLYIKTTELPVPIQLLFRAIRHWPLMRVLNSIGFAQLAAKSNAVVYAKTGACIAICVSDTTPTDFINAGRVMERVWLEAVGAGLAAQPLAGLLYLATYLKRTDDHDINSQLKSRSLTAFSVIQHAVGVTPATTIAMLLRIGTPLRPATARAGRSAPRIVHTI